MNCTANNARDLNYCGATLHIGTTQATGTVNVFLKNEATGRITGMANSGTLPNVAVDLPNLFPDHTYSVTISDGKAFTPYASDNVIGTTAVDSVFVRFVKLFNGDDAVLSQEDQYLKLIP